MLIVLCLVVFYPTYQVTGQLDCSQCACCKNSVCRNEGNNACKNGCIDGFWGDMCTNKCTDNCLSCPQDFRYSQYCTKCKNGFYLNKYANQDYGACLSCNTQYCQTCTSWSNCSTCNDGFFNDLSLEQHTTNCRLSCPSKCKSCVSNTECVSCNDGYYNGHAYNYDINAYIYHRDCRLNCRRGCKKCTHYDNCNECYNGYYGITCQGTCNDGCLEDVCSKESGACVHGCKIGYKGEFCNSCDTGFYYLDKICSNCTTNCASCSFEGFCTKCTDRYTGVACQTPCPDKCRSCVSDQNCKICIAGYFGQTCSQSCSANCLDGDCNINNGNCLACKYGYSGSTCNDLCQNTCLNRDCKIDGSCKSCEAGFHGKYCSNACLNNCITCNDQSWCTKCQIGYYGYTCNLQCPNCLEGTTCQQLTGFCDYGCKDGFTSSDCRAKCNSQCKACEKNGYYKCTKCVDGRYGWNSYLTCSSYCSPNCLNSTCDERNGTCVSGCVKGRWGQICSDMCSVNCINAECYQNNGSCLMGCKYGYKGNLCNCPTNCECDETGKCTGCETGFANTDSSCTCRTDICLDEFCLRCTNNSYFTHDSYCCPCSSNCRDGICVSASNCSYGCKSGYYDDGCDKMCADVDQLCTECPIKYGNQNYGCSLCKPGYYPAKNTVSYFNRCMRCQNTCLDSECDGTNGICIKGCVNRKWGLTCQEDCPTNCLKCNRSNGKCFICKGGTYLSDCSQPCTASCNKTEGYLLCEIETGSCLSGCLTFKIYGEHCDKNCSRTCKDNVCHWQTGECLQGCTDNVWGKQCENFCSNNCIAIEGSRICNESNGHCQAGCADGYFLEKCDKRCSINCQNTSCDIRGNCLYGCSGDFIDDSCLQVKSESIQGSGDTNATIGGSVGGVAALFLIILVATVIVLCKRRIHFVMYEDGLQDTYE